MKRALLVSPYFLPSNLAGVHRVRLMVRDLSAFGWEPIVLTVDSTHYEEANDESSRALLPETLRIESVNAWPARVCRPLGFGDIALRGQFAMRRRVAEIVRRERVDVIFCTVLPGYSSLVGAWAKRKFGIPFVLDYQDPWVSDWGARQPVLSKAGIAHRLALWLEPGAIKQANALTAVSDGTLDPLRARNLVKAATPIEIIPIGADRNDHEVAMRTGRSWIQRREGEFVLAYIGTVTDGMLPSVRTLFRAVRALVKQNHPRTPRIHFIGTSAQPDGHDTLRLEQLAAECGVREVFRVEPRRIGYLDALRSMEDADVLLLLGSQDPHYTASKVFPCWLTGKPVLGLFHSASTVNQLARELGGISSAKYDSANGPGTCVLNTTKRLQEIVTRGIHAVTPRNEAAFEPYSARGIAQKFATIFNRVSGSVQHAACRSTRL